MLRVEVVDGYCSNTVSVVSVDCGGGYRCRNKVYVNSEETMFGEGFRSGVVEVEVKDQRGDVLSTSVVLALVSLNSFSANLFQFVISYFIQPHLVALILLHFYWLIIYIRDCRNLGFLY